MQHIFKEKTWSVRLIKGYVLNNQVRAPQCENCNARTQALTTNFGNPNLYLYGCKESKCQHRLLRLDFDDDASFKPGFLKSDRKTMA
ncbi:MAG: hypothetical protein ABSG33_06985 [Candidatus Bathyarchaeia archaeon]|jgi:hypothetical protein